MPPRTGGGRSDRATFVAPATTVLVRAAREVAGRALSFAHLHPWARPVAVNGLAGAVVAPRGRPFSVTAFNVVDGRIADLRAVG